jgi:uroporphyrinogen decarboxylase
MPTHRQRLETTLSGQTPDRTPIALWRHFPVDDQTPDGLAAATLDWQRTYDFDLVKVTPTSSFCLKDWGSRDEWRGDSEGTRTYTHNVIQTADDWLRLRPLDPTAAHLAAQLAALRLITAELGPETPVLQTVFSPLSQAKNLVGKNHLLSHLRQYPQQVHAALGVIAESTVRFVEAAAQLGIAGVFYAVQHANYGLLNEAEYAEFGEAYDRIALEPAKSLWFNMLHLHGEGIMFDRFANYPIACINWHDRDTAPSLAEAQQRFDGVLCGGLQREQMVLGTPETVAAQARNAIEAAGGKRFLLGTGCVLQITTPRANLWAVRRAIECVSKGR